MIGVRRLRIGTAILAFYFAGATDIVQGQIKTFDPSKPWENTISIGDHSQWAEDAQSMTVALPPSSRTVVVPHNLADAMRRLDSALPGTYSDYMSARTSRKKCLGEGSENSALLHSDLIYLFADKWLHRGSKVSNYIDKNVIGAKTLQSRRLVEKLRLLKSAWLLCVYYNWKKDGVLPPRDQLAHDLQENLPDLDRM